MIYINEEHIKQIASLVYSYSGICPTSYGKQLEKQIETQMNLLAIANADDYIYILNEYKFNSKALDDLATALTTSETYFFRNPFQFDYMLTTLLPAIRLYKQPFQPVKIWSLGCSCGEEAYSIAMTAKYYNKISPGLKFSINACDINRKSLLKARRGVYSFRSIKNYLDIYEAKFGFKCGVRLLSGGCRVDDSLRENVYFCRANLNKTESLQYLKGSDIIFCRNVLIYFDFDLRKKLFDIFYESLNVGGALFLGETECVYAGRSDFKPVKYKQSVIYKKALGNELE